MYTQSKTWSTQVLKKFYLLKKQVAGEFEGLCVSNKKINIEHKGGFPEE